MGLGPFSGIGNVKEIHLRPDPSQFLIRDEQDHTRVTGQFDGKPVNLLFGPWGSKKIYLVGSNRARQLLTAAEAKEFVQKAVRAYLSAPENYGTTDAADKYESVLDVAAKTLGVGRGKLLTELR